MSGGGSGVLVVLGLSLCYSRPGSMLHVIPLSPAFTVSLQLGLSK